MALTLSPSPLGEGLENPGGHRVPLLRHFCDARHE